LKETSRELIIISLHLHGWTAVHPLRCLNHLTPNGHNTGRTAQLTSRCYILYIYSTNIHTEYFKHAA